MECHNCQYEIHPNEPVDTMGPIVVHRVPGRCVELLRAQRAAAGEHCLCVFKDGKETSVCEWHQLMVQELIDVEAKLAAAGRVVEALTAIVNSSDYGEPTSGTDNRPLMRDARAALRDLATAKDKSAKSAKCEECEGFGNVAMPCPDGRRECLIAHAKPCPKCNGGAK